MTGIRPRGEQCQCFINLNGDHRVKQQTIRAGSLCTGYGGLDMAVMTVFGGHLVWCTDNDKHVAVVLDARYPDVPNLGDLTRLDWRTVESVDIISAGFPCQDISYNGRGAGIEKGERSGIWKNIVEGIRALRPKLIVVENVPGIRRRGSTASSGTWPRWGITRFGEAYERVTSAPRTGGSGSSSSATGRKPVDPGCCLRP